MHVCLCVLICITTHFSVICDFEKRHSLVGDMNCTAKTYIDWLTTIKRHFQWAVQIVMQQFARISLSPILNSRGRLLLCRKQWFWCGHFSASAYERMWYYRVWRITLWFGWCFWPSKWSAFNALCWTAIAMICMPWNMSKVMMGYIAIASDLTNILFHCFRIAGANSDFCSVLHLAYSARDRRYSGEFFVLLST